MPLLGIGAFEHHCAGQASSPQGLHPEESFWSVCCHPFCQPLLCSSVPRLELEDRFTPSWTLVASLEVLEEGENLILCTEAQCDDLTFLAKHRAPWLVSGYLEPFKLASSHPGHALRYCCPSRGSNSLSGRQQWGWSSWPALPPNAIFAPF